MTAERRPPSAPAAVMRSISRREEVCWVGTLAELAAGLVPVGGYGPLPIGIGAVYTVNRLGNGAPYRRAKGTPPE